MPVRGKNTGSRKPAGKRKKGRGKRRTSFFHVVFYSAMAVVAALLISFVLRTWVFEIVRVSSDAMYETLVEGDWVLVTKFDFLSGSPSRGEIVAVDVDGEDGVIIRRVIGMPEERVEISSSGDTLIDGIALPEGRYVSLIWYEPYPEITLGRARYFVMSDNRSVTFDSRDSRIKAVPKNKLSRVRAVVWPLSRRGNL